MYGGAERLKNAPTPSRYVNMIDRVRLFPDDIGGGIRLGVQRASVVFAARTLHQSPWIRARSGASTR